MSSTQQPFNDLGLGLLTLLLHYFCLYLHFYYFLSSGCPVVSCAILRCPAVFRPTGLQYHYWNYMCMCPPKSTGIVRRHKIHISSYSRVKHSLLTYNNTNRLMSLLVDIKPASCYISTMYMLVIWININKWEEILHTTYIYIKFHNHTKCSNNTPVSPIIIYLNKYEYDIVY